MNVRVAGLLAGVPVGALMAALYIFLTSPPALDEPVLNVLRTLSSPIPYMQRVETEVRIGERTLSIQGIYYVDHERRTYDSIATTTLSYLDGETIGTFSIANRVIGDEVYTLVRTESDSIGETVPEKGVWKRFRSGAIAPEYIDISSDRPILDNLVLLRGEGSYLRLERKHGLILLGDESLLKYTFRLSPIALEIAGGTMGAIVNRVGTSGTIELWLDPAAGLRHIVLTAPDYTSTTTLSAMNIRIPVERP